MVKNLPAVWETQIQSLGWENPLEKGKVTHSSIPAWEILWTEKPDELQSMGSQRVYMTEWLTLSLGSAGEDWNTGDKTHLWLRVACILVFVNEKKKISICIPVPGGAVVKNQPAMQKTGEMWVRSLSWEDHLNEQVATQYYILAWTIPWTVEPGQVQSMELQRVIQNWEIEHACKHKHPYP